VLDKHEVRDISRPADHFGVGQTFSDLHIFGYCSLGRYISHPVVSAWGESMFEDCQKVSDMLKSMRWTYCPESFFASAVKLTKDCRTGIFGCLSARGGMGAKVSILLCAWTAEDCNNSIVRCSWSMREMFYTDMWTTSVQAWPLKLSMNTLGYFAAIRGKIFARQRRCLVWAYLKIVDWHGGYPAAWGRCCARIL
jgi:hypothetical protein